jgi:hypothetical protein
LKNLKENSLIIQINLIEIIQKPLRGYNIQMGFLTNIFTHGTLNSAYSTFKNVLGSVFIPIRDATHKFNSIVHTADKYITMARNIPAVGEALAFVQGNPVYQGVIQLANEANSIVKK